MATPMTPDSVFEAMVEAGLVTPETSAA
jgi:hypothetical protein